MDLLTASPNVGSYRAEPYSAIEIDAHPDADRIWATVVALREECEREIDRRIEAEEDEAYDDGYCSGRVDVRDRVRSPIDAIEIPDTLTRQWVQETLAAIKKVI